MQVSALLLLLVLVFVLLPIIGMPILILILFPKTRPVGFSLLAGGELIFVMFLLWLLHSYQPMTLVDDTPPPFSDLSGDKCVTPIHEIQAETSPKSTSIRADTDAADIETKPDWVDAPPRSVGDAYRMSIAVGPYTTRAECDAQLPLQEALDRYVEACLGGKEVRQRIVLPDDYLRQLVKDKWEKVSEHSVGPMITLHVLLEFDRQAKDCMLDQLRLTKIAGRLWFAGFGWVVWLALLGGVYGYLRIAGNKKSG